MRAAWRIGGRDAPDGRVAPKGCRYARHAVCGARRCGADGSRCSAGSLWGASIGAPLCVDSVACWGRSGGGSVDRGAALRGQRRLGASLLRRTASLGEPLCGDGVARGVVVRRGVAVGGAGMGLSRRVRVSRRVSRDPASGGHRVRNRHLGVRMIRRPCLPGEGTARFGVRCEGIAHGPAAGPIASGSIPASGYHLRVRRPRASRAGVASAASPSGGRGAT